MFYDEKLSLGLFKWKRGEMKDTLFIIGNGFDLAMGLKTSYSDFEKFKCENIDAIAKENGIFKSEIHENDDRSKPKFTRYAIDFIYKDCFDVQRVLPCTFWHDFENNLSCIDGDQMGLFYGNDDEDLEDTINDINEAHQLVTALFETWIRSVYIPEKKAVVKFNESCCFLNFNYTDTLQKQFSVNNKDIFYIHGSRELSSKIIFGHNQQPDRPEFPAVMFHGRQGVALCAILQLYRTDKQVQKNIKKYKGYLKKQHIQLNTIKQVYVLGHSLGEVDWEYFEFLARNISSKACWHISTYSKKDIERADLMMKRMKVKNYQIEPNVNEVLENFRIKEK